MEDIVDVKRKMMLVLLATLMQLDLANAAAEKRMEARRSTRAE